MKRLLLPLALCACQSTSPRTVAADPARRAPLLEAVASLEGTWRGEAEGATYEVRFERTSAGSAVRETMFPGLPHEMTNMYTLDGNALRMTHYCAGGNQPHMVARSVDDGRLAFASAGVSDLKAPDEAYMAEMTLVLVDDDHIEEHWTAVTGDTVDHSTVFHLTRVR